MSLSISGVTLYTVEEVASKLQVHTLTILRYIKSQKLPAKKVGKRWLITEESLVSLINPNPATGVSK